MSLTATLTAMSLRPIADSLVLIMTKVHPTFFPYPWASTLHAARISMAYQANVQRTGSKLTWATYLAGYLVMAWGGTLISHFLLSQPPPQLYSIHPYINYLAVHLFLTLINHLSPNILNSPRLNVILFPLDGLLRANAITLTLGHLSPASPVDPRLKNSIVTHLILGAVASCGGGASAATLGTWTPNWAFSTPVVLRGGGLMGTLDVWGGCLVAAIYSTMMGHPAFSGLTSAYVEEDMVLSPLGAKAMGAGVLIVLFGLRVWATRSVPGVGARPVVVKTKTQ